MGIIALRTAFDNDLEPAVLQKLTSESTVVISGVDDNGETCELVRLPARGLAGQDFSPMSENYAETLGTVITAMNECVADFALMNRLRVTGSRWAEWDVETVGREAFAGHVAADVDHVIRPVLYKGVVRYVVRYCECGWAATSDARFHGLDA